MMIDRFKNPTTSLIATLFW